VNTTNEKEPFLIALDRAIESARLIEPEERVLVACSGGPDSTALAYALMALEKRKKRGWRLELAHLHHGLRGAEADLDCAFAGEVARTLGLPFHERRADIARTCAEEGGSIEEVARRERYRFFEEIARTDAIPKIATAHHLDDQIETVLYRIFRGTGIRGLAGIPLRRRLGGPGGPEIVRPFLFFPRRRIRRYLEELGVEAREDRSNAVPGAARNRLRLEIIPFLRRFAPQLDRSIARLAQAAEEANAVLESEAARRLDAAGIAAGLPLRLPLAAVLETPPPLRPILFLRAIERARGLQLHARHATALLALLENKGPPRSLALPGGLRAFRDLEAIVIEKKPAFFTPREPPPPVQIVFPGRTEARAFGVVIEAHPAPFRAGETGEGSPREGLFAQFDLAKLPGPLFLRNPRPGDFFYPLGGPGKKKLQDWFTDAKIPREKRPLALVLEAGGAIVWLVGQRIDRRFAADEKTREALEVRIVPIENESGHSPRP
jgi:tRNA(Ile)-lysidine synthase